LFAGQGEHCACKGQDTIYTPVEQHCPEGHDTMVQKGGGGYKVMPKNKYGILLRYRETCTRVVTAVTYCDDDKEAISAGNTFICVAVEHVGDVVNASTIDHVGGATAATLGVATAVVAPTGILWLLTRSPAADVAWPIAAARLSVAQAQAPNSTQRKHNVAAVAAGIPDASSHYLEIVSSDLIEMGT
jgi:hypothetical protein